MQKRLWGAVDVAEVIVARHSSHGPATPEAILQGLWKESKDPLHGLICGHLAA